MMGYYAIYAVSNLLMNQISANQKHNLNINNDVHHIDINLELMIMVIIATVS